MTRCIIIPVEWNYPLTRTELDSLADFQRVVGGWIEHVGLNEELALLVDEEGRVKHLPINRRATLLRRLYHPGSRNTLAIVGPAVLIGPPSQEDFADVPRRTEELLVEARRFVVRVRSGGDEVSSGPFDSFWEASEVAIVTNIAEVFGDIEVIGYE